MGVYSPRRHTPTELNTAPARRIAEYALAAVLFVLAAALLVLLFAAPVASADSLSTPETAVTQPREMILDIWAQVEGRNERGRGFRIIGPVLVANDTVTSRILIRNGPERTDNITIRGTVNWLVDLVAWGAIGTNLDAWSANAFGNGQYELTFAPPDGIEPNGAAEVGIVGKVRPQSDWNIHRPPPYNVQHNTSFVVTHTAQATNNNGQVVARDEIVYPLRLTDTNAFVHHAVTNDRLRIERKSQRTGEVLTTLLDARIFGPFWFSSYSVGDRPGTSGYNGATIRSRCASDFATDTVTGLVSIVQKTCEAPLGRYPHLSGVTAGKLYPEVVEYGAWTFLDQWASQVTDRPIKAFFRVQANSWSLQVTLDRWPEEPGALVHPHYFGNLAFNNNQALEMTVHFHDGNRTEVKTFWYDGSWRVMEGPARLGPDSPFTSLAGVNKLTVLSDGSAIYQEAPHNCRDKRTGRLTC